MKKVFVFFFSGGILFLGIVGSLFVGYRAYEESKRNKSILVEIQALEREANQVDQENRKLRDRIEYLQSDSFREQEAKRLLEYQKSGEKVVFIRGRTKTAAKKSESGDFRASVPTVLGATSPEMPNPIQWWYEFFGSKNNNR
jgi:cell division protein FtsB